jgi:hypothetical protein
MLSWRPHVPSVGTFFEDNHAHPQLPFPASLKRKYGSAQCFPGVPESSDTNSTQAQRTPQVQARYAATLPLLLDIIPMHSSFEDTAAICAVL